MSGCTLAAASDCPPHMHACGYWIRRETYAPASACVGGGRRRLWVIDIADLAGRAHEPLRSGAKMPKSRKLLSTDEKERGKGKKEPMFERPDRKLVCLVRKDGDAGCWAGEGEEANSEC